MLRDLRVALTDARDHDAEAAYELADLVFADRWERHAEISLPQALCRSSHGIKRAEQMAHRPQRRDRDEDRQTEPGEPVGQDDVANLRVDRLGVVAEAKEPSIALRTHMQWHNPELHCVAGTIRADR